MKIKAKSHLNGNLNHKQTLEHILWIKSCELSYFDVINIKRNAKNIQKNIKWE